MGRQIHRLKALEIERKKAAGYYADGGGLYLQVSPAKTKSWIFRFALKGREREMGLGPYPEISLSRAREKAADARSVKAEGKDPIEERRACEAAEAAEKARQLSFEDATTRYVASHKAGWKNAKHGDQWTNTLKTYAYPVIGPLSVQEVATEHVLKIFEPIWTTKTETATRVRQRIEAVLDWAKTRGHRAGENPARWRGHLENLLPKPGRIQKVQHHPALPYAEMPVFMKALAAEEGVAASGLQFLILTAARTNEVAGACWSEIDFETKLWTVPADRIKAQREHRVPLSDPAIDTLRAMRKLSDGDYVFPGGKKKQPLSNGAFLALLKRMDRTDITAHGFRSTFRDWAAEQTNFAREVAEMALAHAIPDKVEAAYLRGNLFEKRRKLMAQWATYALPSPKQGKPGGRSRKELEGA